jgi:hypothetical protein
MVLGGAALVVAGGVFAIFILLLIVGTHEWRN